MLEKYMPSGNDRAVSPVIGVVLMVGIVVALGAVVGGAVLGLGVGVGETAPNAQFDATYDSNAGDLEVEHVAGDTVEKSEIAYRFNGQSVSDSAASLGTDFNGDTVTAGETATFNSVSGGDTFSIQWTAENGETSSTLFEYTTPAA